MISRSRGSSGLDPVDQTAQRTVSLIELSDTGPAGTRRRRATSKWPLIQIRIRVFLHPLPHTISSQLPRASTMTPISQRRKGPDGTSISKLNEAIEELNRAKEVSNIAPARAVLGLTSDLLPTIRVSSVSIPSIAS